MAQGLHLQTAFPMYTLGLPPKTPLFDLPQPPMWSTAWSPFTPLCVPQLLQPGRVFVIRTDRQNLEDLVACGEWGVWGLCLTIHKGSTGGQSRRKSRRRAEHFPDSAFRSHLGGQHEGKGQRVSLRSIYRKVLGKG